jgi:hypothetical protein
MLQENTNLMSEETLCLAALGRTPIINSAPKQTQITPHPPSRVDLLIELMDEIAYLKEIRQQVRDGAIEADKKLTAEMYITQITLSAYKTALDAQKEAAKIEFTQNNNTYTQIDISNQVKELIQISREAQCKPKPNEPSPS